jgi:phosphoribosylformylglycinamidine synthase
VRIGKHIELEIQSDSKDEAERVVQESCRKLLANPVMEDFSYSLEHVTQGAHA